MMAALLVVRWSVIVFVILSYSASLSTATTVVCVCDNEHCEWYDENSWSTNSVPSLHDDVILPANASRMFMHIGEWHDSFTHHVIEVNSIHVGQFEGFEDDRGIVILDVYGTLTAREYIIVEKNSALSLSMPFREDINDTVDLLHTESLIIEQGGHLWVAGGGRIHAKEVQVDGKVYVRRDGVYSPERAVLPYEGFDQLAVYQEPVVFTGPVTNKTSGEYETTTVSFSETAEVHVYLEIFKDHMYATPYLHSFSTLVVDGHVNWNRTTVELTLWPLRYKYRRCQSPVAGYLIQPHSCFIQPTKTDFRLDVLKYKSRTGGFDLQQRNFCDEDAVQWWLGDYSDSSTMIYENCAQDSLLEALYRSPSAYGPDCYDVPFTEISEDGNVIIGDYFNLSQFLSSSYKTMEVEVYMLSPSCLTHADCSNGMCNYDLGRCFQCEEPTFTLALLEEWRPWFNFLNFTDESMPCGGIYCPFSCQSFHQCENDEDCSLESPHACNENNECEPLCDNNRLDPGETDVDCGGICSQFKRGICNDGKVCEENSDCDQKMGSLCEKGICVSCHDGIVNNNESSTDCGGEYCIPCALGENCEIDEDCLSTLTNPSLCQDGICTTAGCVSTERRYSPQSDLFHKSAEELMRMTEANVAEDWNKNALRIEELDICQFECFRDRDCNDFEVCTAAGHCESHCDNGIQDKYEAALDCGSQIPCDELGTKQPGCPSGTICGLHAACLSEACIDNRCADCENMKRDGYESDVDCGNSPQCSKCNLTQWCRTNFDCVGSLDMEESRALCSTAPDTILEGVGCVDNQCVPQNYSCSCYTESCSNMDFVGPLQGCAACTMNEPCTKNADCAYPLVCFNNSNVFRCADRPAAIEWLGELYNRCVNSRDMGDRKEKDDSQLTGSTTSCTTQENGGLAIVYGNVEQKCVISCPIGWEGPYCDIPRCPYYIEGGYILSSDPLEYCGGVGDCSTLTDPPSCQCDENHRGTACEILDCPGSPDCGGTHGDCTDDTGCVCTSLWDGADCLTPDCPGEPDCGGAEVGSCSTSGGDPHCICSSPYAVGNDCGLTCTPDETCSGRGQCTETSSGVAECVCFDASTYYGDSCQHRFCKPDNTCGGHGTCNQASGICECDSDWYGDACENPDCTGGNGDSGAQQCSGHGTCQSLMGSVQCVCASSSTTSFSWADSDCSQPTCGSVPCSGNGECLDTGGNYPVCSCLDGFSGTHCETVVLPEVCPEDCNGRGECVDGEAGRKVCECQSDFTGSSCSIPYCGETLCNGSGECIAVEDSAVCDCYPGYTGSECSGVICPSDCSGHGDCLSRDDGAAPYCDCDFGYTGEDCGSCQKDSANSVTLRLLIQALQDGIDTSEVLNTVIPMIGLESFSLCGEAVFSTASSRASLFSASSQFRQQSFVSGTFVMTVVLSNAHGLTEDTADILIDSFLRDDFQPGSNFSTVVGEEGRWKLLNLERDRLDQAAICPQNCNGENGRCLYDGSCLCTLQYSDKDCSSPVCPEGEAVREGEDLIMVTCTGRGNCSLGQAIYYEGFSTPILFPNTCECPVEWDGVACESAGVDSCVDDCNYPNGVCDLMGSVPVCACVSPYIGEACNESITDTVSTTVTTGGDAHWIKWTMVGLLCGGAVALVLISILYYRSAAFVRVVKGSDGARIQKLRQLDKKSTDENSSLRRNAAGHQQQHVV